MSPWVAVPVLAMLTAFGILVVTATPINQIPSRLAQLRDMALGRVGSRAPADYDETADDDFDDYDNELPAQRPTGGRAAGDASPAYADDALDRRPLPLPIESAADPDPISARETIALPRPTPVPQGAGAFAVAAAAPSSSCSPTATTSCRRRTCSAPARRRRRAARPTTR